MPSTFPPLQHPLPTNPSDPPEPLPLFTTLPHLTPHITITPLTPALLSPFRRTISLLLPIRYPDAFYTQILSDPATSSLARAALWHDHSNPKGRKRKWAHGEGEEREAEEKGELGTEEDIQAGNMEGIKSSGGNTSTGPQPERKDSTPRITEEVQHPDPESSSNPAPAHLVAAIRCRIEPLPTPSPSPSHTLYIQALALLSPYRGRGIATHLLHAVITSALEQYPGLESVYAHVWEANEEGLEWYRRRGFEVEEAVLEGYYRRLRPAGARVVRRRVGVRDWLGGWARRVDGGQKG